MMSLVSVVQIVERSGERMKKDLEDREWNAIEIDRHFYEDLYSILKLTHMLLFEKLHSEDDGK